MNPSNTKVAQSRRFEEACERMRQNAQKFIDNNVDSGSSGSEDELDDCSIIQKTLQKYNGIATIDLANVREYLQETLTSGAVVCLICIDSIKRNDEIWSCQSCYCMLHLSCIQKWAKDSLYHMSINLEENKKIEPLKWCCPKCRLEYLPSEKPSGYFCFCGKVPNPEFDPWSIPHSCGQHCGKDLKPSCGHACTLLCHPGPCPPCPQTVEVSCYCGKSRPSAKRCSIREWSCGKPCQQPLSCQQHACSKPCHGGECPTCLQQSVQKCLCGSESKLCPCDRPEWQCEAPCPKPLACGNHLCLRVCHGGPCSACPKSGARPCPCQKKLVWLPCTEEVAVCDDTCNKLLACELHRCAQRCHFGSCTTCVQMRVMKCRCGQREKSIPCCKEYTCDNKCKRKRDCGRHNCNKKCCVGNCPPCEAPCLRVLNCKNHKCASRCHPGPCYPCKEKATITCNCGATKIQVLCGRKGSAPRPQCSANCKLPSVCHHPARHKHRCHFGQCPPCQRICEKTLNCTHICPAKCHSAIPTKIESKEKKAGPWDLLHTYKMELVCQPCPSCVVPVPVTCLGGHETTPMPCMDSKPRSCGRQCGRPLMCGNHNCSLECHTVTNISDFDTPTDSCLPCDAGCLRVRECQHPCRKPCHKDACKPCSQIVKMRCHCQLNLMFINCREWTTADQQKREDMACCKNRCPKEMSCGHRCPLTCHKGVCEETCKKRVLVRCGCKRLKKDVVCFKQEDTQLACDEECFKQQEEAKALQTAEMEKERAEMEKKQQEEVARFLEKAEGRKKKRKKKVQEVALPENWFQKNALIVTTTCLIGILLYFGLRLLN